MKIRSVRSLNKSYIFLFFLLCFSGNPLFTAQAYSKQVLVLYAIFLILYTLVITKNSSKIKRGFQTFIQIIFIVTILSLFQYFTFNLVSVPGVLSLILKLLIGLLTLHIVGQNKNDFFQIYIELIAMLSKVSLPLFAFNYFYHFGIQLSNPFIKSLLFYTSYDVPKSELRNSGMFWEPGAFAGYLIIGVLFIFIKNRGIFVGNFKREVKWIIIGVLTTMSTTGYLALFVLFFVYVYINYANFRILLIPAAILFISGIFNSQDFLKSKIQMQYEQALLLDKDEVSNTRFGSLKIDLEYILDKPIIGNGLSFKTRYRFHPWITEDIGNGNGMSNFIAWWGIPFFFIWVFNIFVLAKKSFCSIRLAFLFTLVYLILLQGEQFLNFPLFLIFYIPSFLTGTFQEEKYFG